MASGSDEAFDWSHLVKETLGLEGIGSPRAEQIQEREKRRLTVAMVARQGANVDTAVADPTACVNYLKGKGPVFVVGYCFGGAMTWQAAGRIEGIAAWSSYYGGHTASMADLTPKCPIICHFGRKDAHIPADEIKATLQAAPTPDRRLHL